MNLKDDEVIQPLIVLLLIISTIYKVHKFFLIYLNVMQIYHNLYLWFMANENSSMLKWIYRHFIIKPYLAFVYSFLVDCILSFLFYFLYEIYIVLLFIFNVFFLLDREWLKCQPSWIYLPSILVILLHLIDFIKKKCLFPPLKKEI